MVNYTPCSGDLEFVGQTSRFMCALSKLIATPTLWHPHKKGVLCMASQEPSLNPPVMDMLQMFQVNVQKFVSCIVECTSSTVMSHCGCFRCHGTEELVECTPCMGTRLFPNQCAVAEVSIKHLLLSIPPKMCNQSIPFIGPPA